MSSVLKMMSNPRDMVVYMGYKGKEMFDNTLKRLLLEECLSSTTFTVTERHRLREMLNSEDLENVEVASTLIGNNLKEFSDV